MSDYYLLITDAGKALEAAAHASGEPVKLTDFAVGDGGGSAVTPDAAQTALVNETFRDALSSLTVSPADVTVLEAECIIPASSGGYTIREIGIFADDGTLYAVGNFAEQEKPAPDSGYAASLQIFADLAVSDTSDITLTIQDGTWLTETQANTIYIRQDKQFSEIKDLGSAAQQAARDNLGLKSAATHDVTTSTSDPTAGHLLKVGDGGLLGQSLPVTDANLADKAGLVSMLFNQGGGSNSIHFGGYGCGVHLHYGDSADGTQALGANLFVDANGNLSVEWLAIRKADGVIVSQYIQKLFGPLNKPKAADVGALPITGGTLTGNLEISDTAPIITLTDTNQVPVKKYFLVNDGGNFRLDEDATGGNNVFLWNSSTNILAVNGEVAPSVWTNFDDRYLNADGASFAGFVSGDVTRPYMRYKANNAVVELAKKGDSYTKTESDASYAMSPSAAGWGGVGTYAFLSCNTAQSNGSTVAGSSLFASGVGGQKSSVGWGDKSIIQQGSTMAGTWKCCGNQPAQSGNDVGATLYYRIS